jgi:hypothetical protein
VEPIKVIYIAGAGRSGSTLIQSILGQQPGVCALGEVSELWTEGFGKNGLCGCNRAFLECDFWQSVTHHAYGQAPDVEAIRRLARSVDSRGATPLHLIGGGTRAFRATTRSYSDVLLRLYRSALKCSGATVLVDSSKHSNHGLVLARDSRLSLHIVHLIRDPRAVVFSWMRLVRNLNVGEREVFLSRYSPRQSALAWNLRNITATLAGRRAETYTRVRYEDFAAQPKATIAKILAAANHRGAPVSFASEHEVTLEPTHIMWGNPKKFSYGRIPIELDDEWRHSMRWRDRATVAALTWPLAKAYGYY